MRIPLDYQSSVPIYRQIETYLREGILSGRLTPDTRLPASRKLAQDLAISRITVENAYAELKADGLITAVSGSGTYVLPICSTSEPDLEDSRTSWPLWQQSLPSKGGIENRLSSSSQKTNLISFANGNGDPHLFPISDFRHSLQTVIRRDGITALEYGDTQGFIRLRKTITSILASQGLLTGPGQILITSGSQQALGLVCQLLLKSGDVILVENPTYGGALNLFRTMGLSIIGIPMDEDGMLIEKLEELLQQFHPKLIYTMPNFQNPTGICMDSWRRRQLLSLADRYNVPLLEDDFVGDLRYDGRTQPALKSLDPGGRVIYTSTFSKMLLPGLRVGFLVAEGPVYEKLVNQKKIHDLATSNLMQRALEDYISIGRYQSHLRRSCLVYRKRRDVMLQAVKSHLPAATVNSPQGGLFIWLRLPNSVTAEELLALAWTKGVSFTPGNMFFPNQADGQYYLRLNFASHSEEVIEEGIKRLGEAMNK